MTASPPGDRLAHAARDPAHPTAGFATRLRGFGPIGIAAILVVALATALPVKPLGAIAILGWARASHTPRRELGLTRPKNWTITIVGGAIAGVVFKLLMKSLIMPLLGADPVNHAYQFLVGNRSALVPMMYAIVFGAVLQEELFYRGFLFERLGALVGTSRGANAVIVATTTILFAASHYPEQGVWGVTQAIVTGTVFGGAYLRTRRLALPMIMHGAFDITAVALIYWNVDSAAAHLFFR